MILLTVCLMGFGTADLVRWKPETVGGKRVCAAELGGLVAAAIVVGLGGYSIRSSLTVEVCLGLALLPWLLFDRLSLPPAPQVAFLAAVIGVAFGCGSLMHPVSGELSHWYAHLPFAFARRVEIDQFLIAVAALTFALATSNRIVRLILEAAGTPARRGEERLKGGRILGPMERIFIGAMVASGSVAAAAALIAAKGLLRLPETRRPNVDEGSHVSAPIEEPDHVTEYLLIGTFSSLLVACLLALSVLATG